MNRYLRWVLIIAGIFGVFILLVWIISGRPYLKKETFIEYRLENFEEMEKEYLSLYDDFLQLDTSLTGQGSLKVSVSDRRYSPWIFWRNVSGSISFFNGEWYLKNDLTDKPEFGVIQSKMKRLNISSVLMLNRQILMVPKHSRYYFADEFILMKLPGDTLFDETIIASSNKINENAYLYIR